jgi:hypothetical protein
VAFDEDQTDGGRGHRQSEYGVQFALLTYRHSLAARQTGRDKGGNPAASGQSLPAGNRGVATGVTLTGLTT